MPFDKAVRADVGGRSLPTEASDSCPLVVIVGPTAVGKTALSLCLAEDVDAEIVSADSRLVYRGLDIGTAKPSEQERIRIPHHLIDVVDPDEVLTLAEYQQRAYQAIGSIHRRGRLPLLVGGSGQYIWAVAEGWRIPRVPPNPEVRARLEAFAEDFGARALHARLSRVDAAAAAKIDYRNVRRVIRALEVTNLANKPISELQSKSPPPYRILLVGLTRPRPVLYQRIDERIDQMIGEGWIDEVHRLLDAGYSLNLPAMSGLGYRQIGSYLTGETGLEEAVKIIRRETRRFLRQQSAWFRPSDERIEWFDLESVGKGGVVEYVRSWV